jgi:hypothetical protein
MKPMTTMPMRKASRRRWRRWSVRHSTSCDDRLALLLIVVLGLIVSVFLVDIVSSLVDISWVVASLLVKMTVAGITGYKIVVVSFETVVDFLLAAFLVEIASGELVTRTPRWSLRDFVIEVGVRISIASDELVIVSIQAVVDIFVVISLNDIASSQLLLRTPSRAFGNLIIETNARSKITSD